VTGTERTARPRLIRRGSAHDSSEHGNRGDSEGHDPGRSSVVTCRHPLLSELDVSLGEQPALEDATWQAPAQHGRRETGWFVSEIVFS
jgi:hypothetical protein